MSKVYSLNYESLNWPAPYTFALSSSYFLSMSQAINFSLSTKICFYGHEKFINKI